MKQLYQIQYTQGTEQTENRARVTQIKQVLKKRKICKGKENIFKSEEHNVIIPKNEKLSYTY